MVFESISERQAWDYQGSVRKTRNQYPIFELKALIHNIWEIVLSDIEFSFLSTQCYSEVLQNHRNPSYGLQSCIICIIYYHTDISYRTSRLINKVFRSNVETHKYKSPVHMAVVGILIKDMEDVGDGEMEQDGNRRINKIMYS